MLIHICTKGCNDFKPSAGNKWLLIKIVTLGLNLFLPYQRTPD